MKYIYHDLKNQYNIKVRKHDHPIYILSLDLKNSTHAQLNIVTEYISPKLFNKMITQPTHKLIRLKNGKKARSHGTIFNYLGNGQFQLGYESGILPARLVQETNPNVPHVHVPSFLARIGCQYSDTLLPECVQYLLDFARAITRHGVQDDRIMGGKNYALNLKAMDKIDLVISARVPSLVKNAIPTLDHTYQIKDIYAKTKKPLKGLIRRAYLVPPRNYLMHVFNDGVAKLQAMTPYQVKQAQKRNQQTYITWSDMQKIRLKQKPLTKIVKRKKKH